MPTYIYSFTSDTRQNFRQIQLIIVLTNEDKKRKKANVMNLMNIRFITCTFSFTTYIK